MHDISTSRGGLLHTHIPNVSVVGYRIVVIEAGRAVEQGTHAALMQAGGLYARLVRTQAFEGEAEAVA